jgi:hypothetical protein
MQAVIQSLESMVLALAVAAFAHFGVALKVCHCPKAAAPVERVAYPRAADPRTIRRAPTPLANDLHRA